MVKAATSLGLSQPTISLHIKKLEEELDVKLFERFGPNIKLTVEGRMLYKFVNPLVQGVDHLKENFSMQSNNLVSGELTIAAEGSTIQNTLPNTVLKFVKKYPGIRLKILSEVGRAAGDLVLSEVADFAVGSMSDLPDKLVYQPLFSYPSILIMPKNHPLTELSEVTLSDIGQYEMILPPPQFNGQHVLRMMFALNGIDRKVVLEVGSWEVIKMYVSLGIGISIVDKICVSEADLDRLAMVDLSELIPATGFGIFSKETNNLSMPAQKFIKILKTEHYKDRTLDR